MSKPYPFPRLVLLFALLVTAFGATRVAAGFPISPSFAGISLDDQAQDFAQTAWPPSPSAAVGPDHIVEMQNQTVGIFSKTGTRLKHLRLRDFLKVAKSGVTYQATFDPRVVYDARSGRWFAACVAFGNAQNALPDPVILAVSKTPNPLGAWSQFVVPLGEAATGKDFKSTGLLTLGLDQKAVYFGVRIFPENSAEFCKIAVTLKAPLVASHPSLGTVTQFSNLTGLTGSPYPALNYDVVPGNGSAFAVASRADSPNLRVFRIGWSGNTPTLSSTTDLVLDPLGELPDAPQLNSATLLDTSDSRVQSAVLRNNTLWTCRTIGVNSSGGGSNPTRTGCEWTAVATNVSTPTLAQTGRIFDNSADNPKFYFQPTLSVNSQDTVVVGYARSSATEFVGADFALRTAATPQNQIVGSEVLKNGETSYVRTVGDDSNPWGRHGAVAVDPADDFSIWCIQPYAADTEDSWGTWIGRVQIGDPPGSASVTPQKLAFKKVKVGKSKSLSFTISSKGPNPLVGSVSAQPSDYSITSGGGDFELEAGQKRKVTVKFTPTKKGPAAPESVLVTTNDPHLPGLAIPLTGSGK